MESSFADLVDVTRNFTQNARGWPTFPQHKPWVAHPLRSLQRVGIPHCRSLGLSFPCTARGAIAKRPNPTWARFGKAYTLQRRKGWATRVCLA